MTDTNTADMNEALAGNYLLVTLSIRKWSARKPDKSLAAEAAQLHGATPEAVSATRRLMAGADSELRAVETALNAIRTYLYSVSVPWCSAGDDGSKRGPRLVPTKLAMPIIAALKKHQIEFDTAFAAFKLVYAQRVQDALRNQGTLADASAYPSEHDLDDMFSVRLDISPVPSVGDFSRMNVPAELATALGTRMAKRQSVAVENAINDLHGRIIKAVTNMAKVLGTHGAGEKTRLHASLVTNVKTLGGLLRDTNITNDANLTELADKLDKLTAYDIKQLKASPTLAATVAADALHVVNTDAPALSSAAPTTTAPVEEVQHTATETINLPDGTTIEVSNALDDEEEATASIDDDMFDLDKLVG